MYPYEQPVAPESVNISPKKIKKIISRFRGHIKSGKTLGGQLVVRRHGKVVINLAEGFGAMQSDKDLSARHPITPKTLFPAYSQGKPLAALAIALLESIMRLPCQAKL